ncbi:MAG: class I SAM-dependent methyltransferase [Armatimonadota bacterium]|nr:class I SAM-dependent methyltransferase [Armatimonadota bacterium]
MPDSPRNAYTSFWDQTGNHFPSLKGAPSTAYYAACEQTLLDTYFPALQDRLLLKTDLWDEAKNTEILRWAAERGARPVGVDIAASTVKQARAVMRDHGLLCAAGDVRQLPFRSDAFDLIYSMGTIEHFPETQTALEEMFRVLKPGGVAIIGVPNLLDPFLRPLLVRFIETVARYPYGMEKAYTAGALRRMVRAAGFHVTGLSGILFMPGWLRMLDLWLHARRSPWTRLTAALVVPFAWAYRRFPAVRRHGYLIACVATKPDGDAI